MMLEVELFPAESGIVPEEEPVISVLDDAVVVGSAADGREDASLVFVRSEDIIGNAVYYLRIVSGERAVRVLFALLMAT